MLAEAIVGTGMILGTRLWYGFFGPEKDDGAALDDDAANACVHPRLTFRRSCSACEERAPPGTKTRAQLRRLLPLSAVVISYAS